MHIASDGRAAMPWYGVVILAPCATLIMIVIIVAVRPQAAPALVDVLRELPPVLEALLPGGRPRRRAR